MQKALFIQIAKITRCKFILSKRFTYISQKCRVMQDNFIVGGYSDMAVR